MPHGLADLRLAQEALEEAGRLQQVRMDDLERHHPIGPRRAIDLPHPAGTEFGLNRVGTKLFSDQQVVHLRVGGF